MKRSILLLSSAVSQYVTTLPKSRRSRHWTRLQEGRQTCAASVAHGSFPTRATDVFFLEAPPHATDRLLPAWAPSEPLAVLNPVGQLIGAGGPVIVVLLGMSILALTVVAKVGQFASLELNQLRTVRHVLALHLEGESTEALAVARRCRNPAAAVLAQAIRG